MWGVGVLGAGPGVSALHLPTLARLADEFRVVHIADAGSGRAEPLARAAGAAWSTGDTALLADPAVDVVAVCSPPAEHAAHVRAAVRAGKKAIFCEKPLALDADDALDVIEECRAAGVALVVGTNHLYDPAWGRAKHHITAAGGRVHAITVTVCLPPNDRYHRLVAEMQPGAAPARRPPDWSDPRVASAVVRQLVLGLGIHDLPLVRDLAPRIDRVVYAHPVEPIGYAIGALSGDILIQLTAVMVPEGADALWRIAVSTARDLVDIAFRPAFVHDGGAEVRVRQPDGRITEYPSTPEDGYVAEWRALAALLHGVDVLEYAELIADAEYAIEFADAAAEASFEAVSR